MTVKHGIVGNGNKRRTKEPETRNTKIFSSIHMFRQQEATYSTKVWSVKHSRRYRYMSKAWKSGTYHRGNTVADGNMEL